MPHRGNSNEYPQHLFSLRNKKHTDNFWLKKKKNALSRAMLKIILLTGVVECSFRSRTSDSFWLYIV